MLAFTALTAVGLVLSGVCPPVGRTAVTTGRCAVVLQAATEEAATDGPVARAGETLLMPDVLAEWGCDEELWSKIKVSYIDLYMTRLPPEALALPRLPSLE